MHAIRDGIAKAGGALLDWFEDRLENFERDKKARERLVVGALTSPVAL